MPINLQRYETLFLARWIIEHYYLLCAICVFQLVFAQVQDIAERGSSTRQGKFHYFHLQLYFGTF